MKTAFPQRYQEIKPCQNEDASPDVPEKQIQPWGFIRCLKQRALKIERVLQDESDVGEEKELIPAT